MADIRLHRRHDGVATLKTHRDGIVPWRGQRATGVLPPRSLPAGSSIKDVHRNAGSTCSRRQRRSRTIRTRRVAGEAVRPVALSSVVK